MFHIRLSLSVIDAVGGVGHPGAHDIATELIHRTVALGDGYAVRDVLAHGGCAAMLFSRARYKRNGDFARVSGPLSAQPLGTTLRAMFLTEGVRCP